jgi:ankyrin repeat protein
MATLFDAVEAADPRALSAALAQARDTNPLGPGRTTPLIEAARRGWGEGVRLLLEAGAEASWRDEADETALLKAAANGHRAVVRLLEPLSGEDDRALAEAFLQAFGSSSSPEYQYDESRIKTKAVELVARAADLLGHQDPARRVERVQRAEAQKGKK